MKTVAQMASSIQRISEKANLRPAARSLFRGLITGITGSGSVVLSEIFRDQVDDDVQLHAAEQRASYTLKTDAGFDRLPDAYLELVAPVAKTMRFRTVDGSDIGKPASRTLEALDVVRDGSAKPRERVAVGPRGVEPVGRALAQASQPSERSASVDAVDSMAPTAADTQSQGQARNPHKRRRFVPSKPKRVESRRKTRRPRVQARATARKEEKKARVKFPSAPALKQLGYWSLHIETGDGKGYHLPLFQDLFSKQDPAHQALGPQAWNLTFHAAIERVLKILGPSGVWLFDRGFDDKFWMNAMHECVDQYVIRLKANRWLRPGTTEADLVRVSELAASLHTPHTAKVRYVKKSSHQEKTREVSFGWVPVWTEGVTHAQYLVVVWTGRKKPLLLVTDRRPENAKEAAEVIVAYFERWGSEEMTRFGKQATGLEGMRVRSLPAMRRLCWLAMIAVGIQALMTLTCPKLRQATLSRAKQFIRTVRFILYRIWRVVQKDVQRAIDRRSPLLLS